MSKQLAADDVAMTASSVTKQTTKLSPCCRASASFGINWQNQPRLQKGKPHHKQFCNVAHKPCGAMLLMLPYEGLNLLTSFFTEKIGKIAKGKTERVIRFPGK